MDDSKKIHNDKGELNQIISKVKLEKIKSNYILKKLFNNLHQRKALKIIKNNKKIQKRLNININHYKECSEIYSTIEIEIFAVDDKSCNYVSFDKKDELFYHIEIKDIINMNCKNDINNKKNKSNNLVPEYKINIVSIKIDYQVKSFYKLFYDQKCIKSIYFKKFFRKNINNMKYMFCHCSSLKKIDLSNFNTDKVTDMSYMFSYCSSLKEIDLSKFNTEKVTDMNSMFSYCSLLTEINLSNFNTNNVNDMGAMFSNCSSLKVINISNFNTSNVTNMSCMFNKCMALERIYLSNFNINKVYNMNGMFCGCPNGLEKKILRKTKKINNKPSKYYI